MNQLWSWALAAVGITGIWLAGRNNKMGWALGVFAQLLWLAYAIATRQWGFIATALAYGVVYGRNWWKWRQRELADSDGTATYLHLADSRDTLKAIRETLCIAQNRIGNSGIDQHRIASDVNRIGRIIAEIDRQRPLGSNGKHGGLHTATCGCERFEGQEADQL